MKLKNLLTLILTAFLFSSLYAQKENPEMQIINELKILDEPSTMPFDFDYTGNQEFEFDNLIKSAAAKIDSNLAQQLQNVLDDAISEYDIKGLSAALSAPNGDIWKGASGISHDTVEITTDMLFGIASITKNFMATIIMQLYEADSLKLNDSLYKWLPPFENIDSTVTIRQLLNHTSGIYNYTNYPAYFDSVVVSGSRIWTPEEILETFVLLPSFLPGTNWEYSNTNYILLGMIIEAITGNEVVSELHNRLTIPLELNSTFLFPDEGYEGVRAHVWIPDGDSVIDVTEIADTTGWSAAWTAGGLMSTAEDIVKWSKGLNEGDILNDTTLALMRVPAPYSGGSYGLGTSIWTLNSQWVYGHSGDYGYYSELYYVADDSLSISVISNQRFAPTGDIWIDLYNTYMDFISSQPCLPEGITFSSQEEIDNFQTNYPNCTEIEGDVEINGDLISNMNGLNVLTSIGGDLNILYNDALPNLTGLDNVTSIGGDLWISNNTSLASLTGLGGLTFLGGDLNIGAVYTGNPLLTNFMGLEELTTIGEDLWIRNNAALTNLTGLNNVTSIGGDLKVIYNGSLINLTGLDNVTYVGGNLIINKNDVLISLTGLDNLSHINGNLAIGYNSEGPDGNPSLSNLVGLSNLDTIDGYLGIYNNPLLTSLTGLNDVTSIGGDLWILYNNSLTSLTGLDNINAASINNLDIYHNGSLSACAIQSICDYLAAPNGTIEIHDNGPGCNTQEEVEEACDDLTNVAINAAENYSIYPNPVTDIASFSSEEITSFELYDLMGKLIIRRNSNKVDMSSLNPGIYFVIGFDKNKQPLYKGKIIKK